MRARGQKYKQEKKKELKGSRDKAENRKKHLKNYHQLFPRNKRLCKQKTRTDAIKKE